MSAQIAKSLLAMKSLKHTGRALMPDEVDTIIDHLLGLKHIIGEAKHANSAGFKMTNGKIAHEGFESAIYPFMSIDG